MRGIRILLLLVLAAGVVAAYFALRAAWHTAPTPDAPRRADAPTPAEPASAADIRPTFDIVRAEQTGDLLIAGRAQPGSTVSVENNGKPLGSAVADQNGEWIIQPDKPLTSGEHALELKSHAPGDGKTVFSKQHLALSLGGDAGKSRPLVALTEEGQATRVLQMAPPSDDKRTGSVGASAVASIQAPSLRPAGADAAAAQVSFTSIDYEEADGANTIFLTGQGTPGARLMLYVDDQFAGTVIVDAAGAWTFKGARALPTGTHVMRADSVDIKDARVLARAEVNFDRQDPNEQAPNQQDASPRDSQVAALNAVAPGLAPVGDRERSGVKVASTGEVGSTTSGDGKERVIVVRRGDTLWQIAQRRYGNGARYTEIFQSNRGQIRNPNRIYPSQRIAVPR